MTLLPGHRARRLTVLDCGLFVVRGGERTIGIPAFLVTTDRGAQVLIDGGFPPGYDDAQARRDGLPAFGALVPAPDCNVTAQLARLGLTPADITLHVLTHGHVDHVGALSLVACPLVLTARERAEPQPLYFGTARPLPWPDLPTHRIEAETDLCQGLTLIPTPGHTPGHLSVLVTLPEGPVILAADAINRRSEPAEGFPDAMDPAAAADSAAHLHALQARLGAMLVWGHDPVQWPSLPKAPVALVPG
ncbi:MAG: MBL fold metallo-hydrolase [Gemmobacter sp.]